MTVPQAMEKAKLECIRENFVKLSKTAKWKAANISERQAMLVIECSYNQTSLKAALKQLGLEL